MQLSPTFYGYHTSFQTLHGGASSLGTEPWRSTRRDGSEFGPELLRAQNCDGDGTAETVLVDSLYLDPKSHWWFTDGTDKDVASFTTTDFTPGS
ncbi:hypothetical protein NKH77_46770 [Streptomyces sp. M19]